MSKSDAKQKVDSEKVAVPLYSAVRLTGVSESKLRSWERNGLLPPKLTRQIGSAPTVRLYGFDELVSILVIKELSAQRLTPQHIRKVVSHLRRIGYQSPLTELRFAVVGSEVFFQHPDGTWEGDRKRDQIVIHQVLDLEALQMRVRSSLGSRRPEDYGRIERRRRVMGSKPVFAGTRVPVAVVEDYLRAGASTQEILEAFPSLTAADLREAKRAMREASA